ncbi:DedA family protein [uncultured Micrococcus sp.]|uniref:DedA family protein n=1 Tax=uncultured Micrococcus sp. TaxID=114051 RepID=UPI00130E915C|nr:DedA family protein [uncultured Micrococcus sp.]
MFARLEDFILHAAAQWWVLPFTWLMCVLDGLVPVFPSESLLVALAAIVDDGRPFPLGALWVVGMLGALIGDNAAYALGRIVGVDRWRWMRTSVVAGAMTTARRHLDRRGAFLLLTARFVPGGRVAVNLTAGANRYSYPRFLVLDAVAASVWSAYSILIARLSAGWLDSPLLQIVAALLGAAIVGLVLDRIVSAALRRRGAPAAGEGPRAD